MRRSGIKRKTPLRRTPMKRGKKSKRAKDNARYETEVRRRSWQNAPPHPDPERWHLYQLDHVVPIHYGKKSNGVCTVERMSSRANLQWLLNDDNYTKGIRLTPAARELITKWRMEDDKS